MLPAALGSASGPGFPRGVMGGGGGFRAAALECVCLHAPVGPGRTPSCAGGPAGDWGWWLRGGWCNGLRARARPCVCYVCVYTHTHTCSCACVQACTGQGGKQCCRRGAWGALEWTPRSLPWNHCLLPSPGLRYCLLPPSYLSGSQIRFGTFPPLARGATKIAGVPGDWVSRVRVSMHSAPWPPRRLFALETVCLHHQPPSTFFFLFFNFVNKTLSFIVT